MAFFLKQDRFNSWNLTVDLVFTFSSNFVYTYTLGLTENMIKEWVVYDTMQHNSYQLIFLPDNEKW